MYLRYVKIIPRLTNLKKMSGINLWNQLIKQANFYGGLSHKEPYHMWQWMLMRDSADTSYTVLELFSNEKCFMIINSASSAQIIFFFQLRMLRHAGNPTPWHSWTQKRSGGQIRLMIQVTCIEHALFSFLFILKFVSGVD